MTQIINTKNFLRSVEERILSLPSLGGRDISLLFTSETVKKINIQSIIEHVRIKSIYVLHEGEIPPESLGKDVGYLLYESGEVLSPQVSGEVIVSFIPIIKFRRKFALSFYRKNIRSILLYDGYSYCDVSMFRFILDGVFEQVQTKLQTISYPELPNLVKQLISKVLPKRALHKGSNKKLNQQNPINRIFRYIFEFGSARDYAKISLYSDGYILDAKYVSGRIFLVNYSLAAGGVERQLVNTSIGLKNHGFYDVTILCNQLIGSIEGLKLNFYLDKVKNAGINVLQIKSINSYIFDNSIERVPYNRDLSLTSNFPIHLCEMIDSYFDAYNKNHPEVVHLWQDQTNILAGFAAVFAKVPNIILSVRNIAPVNFAYYKPWMREGYRTLLKFPNVRILANSHAGAQSYAEWLGVPLNRFKVIHNGFYFGPDNDINTIGSNDLRARLGIPNGPVVGSVFRFWQEKDPILWVKTAAEIAKRNKNISFLLVGSGPMQSEIQELAKENGIFDILFMPGSIDDVFSVLKIMDVFLLTSIAEGLPNVLIEAQAMSVPVVSTDGGGSSEAVLNGETGWVVQSRNPSDLADKVTEILADDEWREKARVKSPKFIKDKFGLDRMVDETLKSYFPTEIMHER